MAMNPPGGPNPPAQPAVVNVDMTQLPGQVVAGLVPRLDAINTRIDQRAQELGQGIAGMVPQIVNGVNAHIDQSIEGLRTAVQTGNQGVLDRVGQIQQAPAQPAVVNVNQPAPAAQPQGRGLWQLIKDGNASLERLFQVRR